MKNFNIMVVHWKIWFLGGEGSRKNWYIEGYWQPQCPNAHDQWLSAKIFPYKYMHRHSSEGENMWRRVLEANKKQVPLKSHFLKIKTDSVSKMWGRKERKSYINPNLNILTIITDLKIPCVYLCLNNK